jgi:glucosamine 6-phosphate synthetase-like amidotransferase/phosphosugar isomerase protein
MGTGRQTLLKEILEQPDLWRDKLGLMNQCSRHFHVPDNDHTHYFLGIAEGSSLNALKIVAPFLMAWTGKAMVPMDPNDWLAYQNVQLDTAHRLSEEHAFFSLVVSQSGETSSLVKTVETFCDWQKDHALLVSNRSESTLSKLLPHHLPVDAGEEKSIAATKTLTNTVLSLMLWGICIGQSWNILSESHVDQLVQQLHQATETVSSYLSDPKTLQAMQAFVQTIHQDNRMILMTAGPMRYVLDEGGLKITETCRFHTVCYNSESFKHGPKVLVSEAAEQAPQVVYWVPQSPVFSEQLFRDIEAHTDMDALQKGTQKPYPTRFILSQNTSPIPGHLIEALKVRGPHQLKLPEVHSPLEEIFLGLACFQLMSYCLAAITGEPVNQPSLQKHVTHPENKETPEA